mmetsp:Transcript_16865/g.25384  ORF Transcript_16865/g.25384 Transcript_16865/m.25384 type:complete len:488 (-) Transcript_16865:219-1682(-)
MNIQVKKQHGISVPKLYFLNMQLVQKKMENSSGMIKLGWIASKDIAGLRITRKFNNEKMNAIDPSDEKDGASLVVGTIRMGFGHYRIAYAACSWASGDKSRWPGGVYFHDLLSIDGPEAALIANSDNIYRKSSKMATELGGPFEWLHGYFTTSGDATSLRTTALIAKRLAPTLRGLPIKAPLIAAHSLVALAGVFADRKNIINLVIDNHPQWFVLAPNTLNLIQGPRNFFEFAARRKQLDPTDLRLAGHWIPRDNVMQAITDSDARIARTSSNIPLRVLLPFGGAGAQRKFVTSLVHALAQDIHNGKICIIINAGDHQDIRQALINTFHNANITEQQVTHINTFTQVTALADNLHNNNPISPVVLLAFNEYFPAVSATDVLARAVDILACKPSELAFYPVPKLMIRRVGDHEAFSANRANELADGTAEIRTVEHAVTYLRLFYTYPEILSIMNSAIKTNIQNGIYDGAKNAVAIAAAALWLSSSPTF